MTTARVYACEFPNKDWPGGRCGLQADWDDDAGGLRCAAHRGMRRPTGMVCADCGDAIYDGESARLSEAWRHESCVRAKTAAAPASDADPRSPAYLTRITDALTRNSDRIGQREQDQAATETTRREERAALHQLLLEQRVRIADELNPDTGKPLYSNEARREAALIEWQRETGGGLDHENEIDRLDTALVAVVTELDALARERADLHTEARLAAAWLTYMAGEGR